MFWIVIGIFFFPLIALAIYIETRVFGKKKKPHLSPAPPKAPEYRYEVSYVTNTGKVVANTGPLTVTSSGVPVLTKESLLVLSYLQLGSVRKAAAKAQYKYSTARKVLEKYGVLSHVRGRRKKT